MKCEASFEISFLLPLLSSYGSSVAFIKSYIFAEFSTFRVEKERSLFDFSATGFVSCSCHSMLLLDGWSLRVKSFRPELTQRVRLLWLPRFFLAKILLYRITTLDSRRTKHELKSFVRRKGSSFSALISSSIYSSSALRICNFIKIYFFFGFIYVLISFAFHVRI